MRRSHRPARQLAAALVAATPVLASGLPAASATSATVTPPASCGSAGFGTWGQAVTDHGLAIGVSCARTRAGRYVTLGGPPRAPGAYVEATAVSQGGRI